MKLKDKLTSMILILKVPQRYNKSCLSPKFLKPEGNWYSDSPKGIISADVCRGRETLFISHTYFLKLNFPFKRKAELRGIFT